MRTLHPFLLIWLAIGSVTLPPVLAQTPAAKTYQPGSFQPVVRVDPKKPIQFKAINNSGSTLEFGLTTRARIAREFQPGDVASRKIDTLPASINISPPTRPPFSEISLKYKVTAKDNLLTVTISIANPDAGEQGDRVIEIDDKGGVYVY